MPMKLTSTSFRPNETEESEALALTMLAFMAEQDGVFTHFLDTSGLDLQTLRNMLQRPETLAAIMDYMLHNEEVLAPFCQAHDLTPERLWKLRRRLPGAAIYG